MRTGVRECDCGALLVFEWGGRPVYWPFRVTAIAEPWRSV